MAETRINPCVTVLPLASTIQGEDHAASSLVGAGPPGLDTDSEEERGGHTWVGAGVRSERKKMLMSGVQSLVRKGEN